MIPFGIGLLVLSLVGIVSLFALKLREVSSGRVYFPEWRSRADAHAQQVKELAIAARMDLSKLMPVLVRIGRLLIHKAALGFAILARKWERQAYRVADLVSHKRHYERRETRSEFLKKVAERNVEGLDVGDDTGQNG